MESIFIRSLLDNATSILTIVLIITAGFPLYGLSVLWEDAAARRSTPPSMFAEGGLPLIAAGVAWVVSIVHILRYSYLFLVFLFPGLPAHLSYIAALDWKDKYIPFIVFVLLYSTVLCFICFIKHNTKYAIRRLPLTLITVVNILFSSVYLLTLKSLFYYGTIIMTALSFLIVVDIIHGYLKNK